MSLMKKLTSAVLAASLVTGLVSTAFAAPSADEVNTAYARLSHYGIVQGIANKDGVVEPALEQPITRAQLLTILTRAWGQEDNAKLLKGATTGFSDVDGVAGVEWATGYVFIGSRVAETNGGQKLGTSATTFNPNADLTAIQTLAFVMKFLGLSVPGGDNWVADTVKSAKEAGLITDADEAKYLANPNAAVNRGQAFAMLDNLFASYNKLAGGKTVYTKYIDASAPELTVAEPTLTTDKAEIKVTGSVKGDFTGVFLGSEKITVNADGTFEAVVKLNVGANPFTISAIDMVGNTDEVTYTVTRNPGVAAKITASMAGTLVAGEAADLTISVTDANGVTLEVAAADITVTVGGSVGAFDATTGKFTAAEKVGTGTVTVSYGELTPATVDVTVVAGALAQVKADKLSVAKGDVITLTPADKFGNTIATGVTYTWTGTGIAVTADGKVYTSAAGKYTVTAKAGDATASAEVGVYGAIKELKVAAPESIVANGKTLKAVTVTAIDEFGNAVIGYDRNITLAGVGTTIYEKDDKTGDHTKAAKDGVATFYVALDNNVAGEDITLTATTTTAGGTDITGETTVSAVIPVATNVKVTTGQKYLATNSTNDEGSIMVAVVDQEGVALATGEAYEITAGVTGPAALDSKSAEYLGDGESVEFTFTNTGFVGQTGTITFTFNVEGVGSTTTTTQAVIAGHAEKIQITAKDDKTSLTAEKVFEIKVQTTDRNGVPVSAPDFDLKNTFSISTSTVKLYGPDGDDEGTDLDELTKDGTKYVIPVDDGKATFWAATTGKFTGDVTLSLAGTYKDALNKDISVASSITLNVTPGPVAKLSVDRDLIHAANSTPKGTYVIALADVKGNTVPKADVEIALQGGIVEDGDIEETNWVTANGSVLSLAEAKVIKVKTDATGKATIELVARPYSGRLYVMGADLVDVADVGVEVGLLITDAVPSSIAVELWKEIAKTVEGVTTYSYTKAGNVRAGETFILKVTAKDQYGSPVNNLVGYNADDEHVQDISLETEAVLGGVDEDGNPVLVKGTGVKFYHAKDALADTDGINDFDVFAATAKLGEGTYFAVVTGGKAGLQSLTVKYPYTQTELKTSASIRVYAGALDTIVANGGKSLTLKKGELSSGITVQLADAYGNPVNVGTKQDVTVDVTSEDVADAYKYFSVRETAGGNNVVGFKTSSAHTIYVVGTEVGEYEVTFTLGEFTGTLTVIVEE